MGPLSLLALQHFNPTVKTASSQGGNRPARGMTLLQIQSLNDLGMGNVRTVKANILSLRRGVRGYGRSLFKVHFHPWRMRSILMAQRLCLEVASNRFGFDLLFVERSVDHDLVHVRCPACHAYWPWREGLPNDLRTAAGRCCAHCTPG